MNTMLPAVESRNRKTRVSVRVRRRTTRLLTVSALVICGCFQASRAGAAPLPNLDWPYFGNDLANTRYQNVDQINPANVALLSPAWVFHTGVLDPKASLEVSPIEVNGRVFIGRLDDVLVALDAQTGKVLWEAQVANYQDNYPMTMAPQFVDGLVARQLK